MWQHIQNWVNSLQSYNALSPDLSVRQQVNRQLRSRTHLSANQWLQRYWTSPAVAETYPKPLILFIYDRLKAYSGLAIGRLQPQDRLLEDLQFPAVCWFDWGLNLCEDFQTQFGIDITDTFDETRFETVADLVKYLHQQLQSLDSLSS